MSALPLPVIAKVPLLLVLLKSLQVAMTSPNPTAKSTSEERVKYERDHKTKELLPMPLGWGPTTYRIAGYPIIALEIFAILASVYQDIFAATPVGRLATGSSILLKGTDTFISPMFLVGIALAIFGASIRASCYRHMGRHFTFELTLQKEHKLITSGPYSIVRHPSYLGIFTFYAGSVISIFGAGSFWQVADMWKYPVAKVFGGYYIGYSAYVSLVLFARVAKEDEVLKREFREQWVSWAQKTPYKLIPFVY